MDSITQGLLGATIAQCGFRQKLGPAATWLATFAAIVPDLDLLLDPIMSLSGKEHTSFDMYVTHRGISHSLLFIPIMSLALSAMWWWFSRKKGDSRFLLRYLCILLAMARAPLLDVFTSYGTQLFAPLTDHRFALDAVPIIDFIYSPILIITLILCRLFRWGSREHGRKSLVTGIIGLTLSTAYLFTGFAIHEVLVKSTETSFTSQGYGPARYEAYPQIPTIFVWRVVRFDGQLWTTGKVNVLFGLDIKDRPFNEIKQQKSPWIEQARETREVKIFAWFTDDIMRTEYSRHNGLKVAEFYDMRYGVRPDSPQCLWGAAVFINSTGRIVDIEDTTHYRGDSLGDVAEEMIKDIFRK